MEKLVFKRMQMESYFILHTKISLKWTDNLDIRSERVKLPEENLGKTLLSVGLLMSSWL
jgi:hypothetical protein